jgi:hypothetical protein
VKIRILGETDRPGFYQFCYVTASPRSESKEVKTEAKDTSLKGDESKSKESDFELDPDFETDSEPREEWVDQTDGGNNAYDSDGRRVPVGVIVDSEVTALGHRILWNPEGPS